MRKAKLHELRLPTRYMVWKNYIHGTSLQHQVGPERFTDILINRQAIELVNWKGFVKCKTLDEQKIKAVIQELSLRPYSGFWYYFSSQLARLRLGTKKP